MLEEEIEQVIKEIDPGLEYVESYNSTLYVCKVKEKDTHFIFKMFDSYAMPDVRDALSWGREHFDNELKALEKLKGVKGVPLLIRNYDVGRHKAFLKEFVSGREAHSLRANSAVIERLYKLCFDMLNKGVILPDVKSNDIIITKDNCPYIIDFGYIMFFDELSSELRKQYTPGFHRNFHSLINKIFSP